MPLCAPFDHTGYLFELKYDGFRGLARIGDGRSEPIYYAFDCLWLNGEDLRSRPTLERKRILHRIVRHQSRVLAATHEIGRSTELFHPMCEHDLGGIVAKPAQGAYGIGWFKVRKPRYSQYDGRRELFESADKQAASRVATACS